MPDLKVGDPAPDFILQDSNGQTVRLADLRGKKVILYFFTSPGGGN
jgi:peroxiredoxin Q/BCP